jgi:hypothetical protein
MKKSATVLPLRSFVLCRSLPLERSGVAGVGDQPALRALCSVRNLIKPSTPPLLS